MPAVRRWGSFDCYGTLIDWDAGIATELRHLWPDEETGGLLADFHAAERLAQREGAPLYREVLTRALRAVAVLRNLPLPPSRWTAIADSLPRWTPFPEVHAALAELRAAGWSLAILSNTDPDYLDASIAQLGVDVEMRVTASAIRSYKPAALHWLEFQRLSGASPRQHVHVAASLFHDIAPCADLGITAIWVNRQGARSTLSRAGEINDLSALPATLEAFKVPLDQALAEGLQWR